MSTKAKQKWASTTRAVAMALCQPTCRMVVLEVWVNDGTVSHQAHPVLAIQSLVKREYTKSYIDNYPARGGSGRDLRQRGWVQEGQSADIQPVILAEGELATLSDIVEAYGCSNAAWQLTVTPWPPEEDEARLAETIAVMGAKVAARVKEEHGP